MTTDDIKKHLCVLKPELILDDEAKEMFCQVLCSIDFKICETDMEMLQLFFKRLHAGIAELKRRNAELRKENAELKLQLPEQQEEPSVITPFESLVISENLSKN